MEAVGKPFDPHVHEAVGEEVSTEAAGNVVREAQAGFMLNGKVLRHAKVIVSKNAEVWSTNYDGRYNQA